MMFTIFSDAPDGQWMVKSAKLVSGAALPEVAKIRVWQSDVMAAAAPGWPLIGVASYVRYVHRPEKLSLAARQAGLGRPGATCAALIPIAKSAAWWELTQEERRDIFEAQSGHIGYSLSYLPNIARQLYHCRDLGQPFDFLTWFEFAPEHETQFDALLAHLRETAEWRFVSREVDIRLDQA